MPKTTAVDIHEAIVRLRRRYTAKGMVDLGNAEDTLIATLLSARTRDEQVLKVYPGLRKAFPTLKDFASATPAQIASKISSIGLFRNKAKMIKALAQTLLEKHHGIVPDTMEELVALPGVGRKTASCVLAYAFKKPAIAVDVHVFRIAHRLGWVKGKTPEDVEAQLRIAADKKDWIDINRCFVQFGRDICQPRTPQCWRCPLNDICAFKDKTQNPNHV